MADRGRSCESDPGTIPSEALMVLVDDDDAEDDEDNNPIANKEEGAIDRNDAGRVDVGSLAAAVVMI